MKALSVRQPWASLLASGTKTIEVRTWNLHYRGLVALCASQAPPTGWYRTVARERGLLEAPRGIAVCVVDLYNVRPAELRDAARACCPIESGDFAWCVRLVARLDPVPVKGRLNLWDIDDSLLTVSGKPLDVSRLAVPRSR